jgi:hypothetical protein
VVRTNEEPPDLGPLGHVRQHLLDQLVAADLLAERLALVGVGDARIQAGPREPDRAGSDAEAALVDGAHGDEEPLALLADPVSSGGWRRRFRRRAR